MVLTSWPYTLRRGSGSPASATTRWCWRLHSERKSRTSDPTDSGTTSMIDLEIVIFDTNAAWLQALRSSFRVPFVSFEIGTGPEVTRSRALDAMWLTPMPAARFGATPPFPLHLAQVIATPPSDVQDGFPRFIVTGVAIAKN